MRGALEKMAGENSANGQAIRCELAAEALCVSGKLRLRVFGGSMLPSIWPGDVLLIRRTPLAEMGLGDLILYASDSGFIVHRIVKKDADTFTTRGDSLRVDDQPVPFSRVLGKIAIIERNGVSFAPKDKLRGIEKILSLLIGYFTPLKVLAFRLNALRLKVARTDHNKEIMA